ncbi:MAG: hypothetical protein Q7W13_03275 [Bacteroidia bacterium]|nr:hypothetical protein [Bacteroidia bacterium]
MKDNNSSEEIDLLSVFYNIKKGFSNFFQSIGKLINFSLQNIKTLIVFVLLGIGISIGIFFLKKTVYVADLTISHTRLNNSECFAMVNDLTKLRDNSNNSDSMLAKKLSIDVKTAKAIKSISCKALNETLEKNYKDSTFVLLPFKIEVKVYNSSILDSLQKGILNYLESNEYAAKRKKINREYLDKYEEKMKKEIIAIDSLKRIVDKSIIPRSAGNGIILGEPIDPVKVYQTGMDLYKSQLRINEQRELNNSFEIVIGFSPAIPTVSLFYYLLVGIISSFTLGLLWLFSRKEKKKNKY